MDIGMIIVLVLTLAAGAFLVALEINSRRNRHLQAPPGIPPAAGPVPRSSRNHRG